MTQRRPVRRCRADETTTLHGADTRPGERERAPAGTIRTEWIAQELGPGSAHLNLLQGVWHRALLLVSSSAGEILGHTAAHGARTTVRARPPTVATNGCGLARRRDCPVPVSPHAAVPCGTTALSPRCVRVRRDPREPRTERAADSRLLSWGREREVARARAGRRGWEVDGR